MFHHRYAIIILNFVNIFWEIFLKYFFHFKIGLFYFQHVHVTEEYGAYEYKQLIPDEQFSQQVLSQFEKNKLNFPQEENRSFDNMKIEGIEGTLVLLQRGEEISMKT